MTNASFRALRAKIRGFHMEATKLSKHISRAKGDRRTALRLTKHELGNFTREHLIAYGLLRGIAYSTIEPYCRKGNVPNAKRILEIIHSHLPAYERSKWSEDNIKKLLGVQQ